MPDSEPDSTSNFLSQFSNQEDAGEHFSPSPEGFVRGRTKFVVVVGTVMSGLGKGIFASSLAKLLQDKGLVVAPMKMEGYLNIDSGTLNPYRHGEVFVLEDGLETDMDLGTYERILNQNLSRKNFITAGQIYTEILERERRGGYLGRDVQMIPHVTGAVKMKIRELAMSGPKGQQVDVVFVEVGGTAGDYENSFYIEALRELAFEEGDGSTCFVALTYIIEPAILGEQKSKAAQLGMKRLMEAGIQPHIIACRAKNPVTTKVMQKISMFSNVPSKRVFSLHDRESIYVIPDAMRATGLDREILSILGLHERVDTRAEDSARQSWSSFARRLSAVRDHRITIGISGKYAALRDAYASIEKAIEHCGVELGAQIESRWLDTSDVASAGSTAKLLEGCDAVIVPGGFGMRGVEGKIHCVEYARTHRLPFLGICLGFQMVVIEHARNVLGWKGANSTEFNASTSYPVISELPDQKRIEGIMGGTMRLGSQDVDIAPGSLASFLFGGAAVIRERFRHRYEVDPTFVARLVEGGLIFSGSHPQHPIMQVLELPVATHPYFIGAQFHPELISRPLSPHPMFMGLVAAAIARREPAFAQTAAGLRWVRSNSTASQPITRS
ncbi:MAG: CTP synthase [Phycisphaerales bacterium]|nr:CTP synthase [Phycisphaerales bacterium]